MELTELEYAANEEARHGNREALEAAQARIAELEGALNQIAHRPHADTCSEELTDGVKACDCHRDVAATALARWKEAGGEDD